MSSKRWSRRVSAAGRGTNPLSPFLASLKGRLELTFETEQNKALDYLDSIVPTSVVDKYSDVKRKKRASTGEERLREIRALLDTGFGVTRSKMQIIFHEHFLAAYVFFELCLLFC